MKSDFELLLKLQMIDDRFSEIETSKGTLPVEVARLQKGIAELKKHLEELQGGSGTIEAEIEQLQQANEQRQAGITKLQDDLYNYVSTNKEYEAVIDSIDELRNQITAGEERIAQLQEQRENDENTVRELTERIEEYSASLEEKSRLLQTRIEQTASLVRKLEALREETVAQIKKPLLNHYERIRKMRDGRGVVPLTRGACGGCFQTIPPQQQAEIRAMKDLIICEICGRIVVSDRLVIKLDLDE